MKYIRNSLLTMCFLMTVIICRRKEERPAYENISESPGSSFTPAIAVDNNGKVYIVWADSTPGNYEIYFVEKANNGTWTKSMNISNNTLNSHCPFIDVDGLGNLHVCWWDISNDTPITRVSYRMRKANGTWDTVEVLGQVSVADSSYNLPRIICDINNNVYVIWEGGAPMTSLLRYRIKRNSIWSEIMVVPDAPACNPAQLATDRWGNLHLVWEGGNYDILYQMRTPNGDWENLATLIQGGAYYPLLPDISVDGSGVVHICWCARAGPESRHYIYYTHNKSGTWAEPIKLPMKKTDDLGWYGIIDSGEDGTLHFIWEDRTKDTTGSYGNADIYYVRKYPGGAWSEVHNISNTGGVSYCDVGSIAVDNWGNAHIVWTDDELGNFEVFYLKIPRDSL